LQNGNSSNRGRLERVNSIYCHSSKRCESEANRFMVRHLMAEGFIKCEATEFIWLQFIERHKLSTTWDEDMIQEEFKKIVGM
jgi:hypothetical protein